MSEQRYSGYTSRTGFLMHGGEERIPPRGKEYAWISLGIVVGLAIVIVITI